MTLRVVVPLLAICLASPAIINAEQAQRGRGYRAREGAKTEEKSGGDTNRSGAAREGSAETSTRTAERRAEKPATDTSTATRAAEPTRATEPTREPARVAVPRENRGGYTVNRTPDDPPIVVSRNPIIIASSHRGYYAPAQHGYWTRRYYHASPIGYAPWLIFGSIGYSNFGFYGGGYPGYGYGYGYGPGPYAWPAGGYGAGGIRLRIRPRDAEVFVDGYYAGLVDDFDGTFQSLKVEPGGHKIEIHMPGFQDFELDVHVQPGRTITISEQLIRRP